MTLPPVTAQCGRTFIHQAHDTTAGWCSGLDGAEVAPHQSAAEVRIAVTRRGAARARRALTGHHGGLTGDHHG